MPLGPVHHHREFRADDLVRRKDGHRVSVCLPARDEEVTVGAIVECIRRRLVDAVPLVDELLVIDDHSTDRTAEVAVAAGAKVVSAGSVLPEYGEGHGKGEAVWKSLFVTTGDLLVWCDADIRSFDERFVCGLVGPLLHDSEVRFVKGFYERPADGAVGGGRVTELTARPALALLFPELSGLVQPLAGEFAARRDALERVPFVEGYGVDLGLILDVAARYGPEVIAQVDLERRIHRHRSLAELGPQARAVLQTVLRRAGVPLAAEVDEPERPPPVTVASYRPVGSSATD